MGIRRRAPLSAPRWVVYFADGTTARADLKAVPPVHRRAIRDGINRLETDGPCIGKRLRGAGLDRFCRYAVPSERGDWRVIYEWPADDPADNEILIYAVGQHSENDNDVYHRLERYLASRHIHVGEWSATEQRLGCCEPPATGAATELLS